MTVPTGWVSSAILLTSTNLMYEEAKYFNQFISRRWLGVGKKDGKGCILFTKKKGF